MLNRFLHTSPKVTGPRPLFDTARPHQTSPPCRKRLPVYSPASDFKLAQLLKLMNLLLLAVFLLLLAGCEQVDPKSPPTKDGLQKNELPYQEEVQALRKNLAKNEQIDQQKNENNLLISQREELIDLLFEQSIQANSSLRLELFDEALSLIQKNIDQEQDKAQKAKHYRRLSSLYALTAGSTYDEEIRNQLYDKSLAAYLNYVHSDGTYFPKLNYTLKWLELLNNNSGNRTPFTHLKFVHHNHQQEILRHISDPHFAPLIMIDDYVHLNSWRLLVANDTTTKAPLRKELIDMVTLSLNEWEAHLRETLAFCWAQRERNEYPDFYYAVPPQEQNQRILDSQAQGNATEFSTEFENIHFMRLVIALMDLPSSKAQQKELLQSTLYPLAYALHQKKSFWSAPHIPSLKILVDTRVAHLRKKLSEDPTFLIFRGMWELFTPFTFFDEDRDIVFANALPWLDKALAKAPDDPLIIAGYLAATQHIPEANVFDTRHALVSKVACLQKEDPESWLAWQQYYTYTDGYSPRNVSDKKRETALNMLDSLNQQFQCPAFTAYAKGTMFYKKRSDDATRDTHIAFLEEGARLHLQNTSAYLINRSLSNAYYDKYWHSMGLIHRENPLTDEQFQQLLTLKETFETTRKALGQLSPEHQTLLSWHKHTHPPFVPNYKKLLQLQITAPQQKVDQQFIDELRSIYTTLTQTPIPERFYIELTSAINSMAPDITRFMTKNAADNPDAVDKVKLLLDVVINELEQFNKVGQLSPQLQKQFDTALFNKMLFMPIGQRAETINRLLRTISSRDKATFTQNMYKQLYSLRLALYSEGAEYAKDELLTEGFADFCLSSGFPDNTALARKEWAVRLQRQAAKASAESAPFLREKARELDPYLH